MHPIVRRCVSTAASFSLIGALLGSAAPPAAAGTMRGMQMPGMETPATAAMTMSMPSVRITPAHTGWRTIVGVDAQNHALQALDYFPRTITINAGDSVTWTIGASQHTITFLEGSPYTPITAPRAPAGGSTEDGTAFTSSGVLMPGQSYVLTFPKPGVYPYLCLFHSPNPKGQGGMTGTVVVNPAGTPYPHDERYYVQQSLITARDDLSAALAAVFDFPFSLGRGRGVAAGIARGAINGPPSRSSVYRFLSANSLSATTIRVPVGATVTWVNGSNNEPHTITFPVAGQPLPPQFQNPFAPRVGGPVYDGSMVVNSGPLSQPFLVPPPWYGYTYQLTFTRPGNYVYYCLFHDDLGMIGHVVVTP